MSRWLVLTACALILGISFNSDAETRTLVFQRGFDGDETAQDTFLYAPESVMNVNFGNFPTIATGRNKWGERLVALIRFDLSHVPMEARALDATLCLYDVSGEFPNQDLIFDVHLVSPENADWTEGNNDGTRIPVKGTSCWNWLSYDSQHWAGAPGLSLKGTDYLTSPIGSMLIPKAHGGWVEFHLQKDVVQSWLGKKLNPGLIISPRVFKEKGQYATFRSSETFEDASTKPKLVLTVEMDDASFLRYRKQDAVRSLENARNDLESKVKKAIGSRDKA
ncbi:DNRLRE domain-containing protein, partial [Candidatus Sumerlaeota bacterium]|nr:DNRLRE domain-containing protein [Candidatus Sumerlaeota bacterium]